MKKKECTNNTVVNMKCMDLRCKLQSLLDEERYIQKKWVFFFISCDSKDRLESIRCSNVMMRYKDREFQMMELEEEPLPNFSSDTWFKEEVSISISPTAG